MTLARAAFEAPACDLRSHTPLLAAAERERLKKPFVTDLGGFGTRDLSLAGATSKHNSTRFHSNLSLPNYHHRLPSISIKMSLLRVSTSSLARATKAPTFVMATRGYADGPTDKAGATASSHGWKNREQVSDKITSYRTADMPVN